MTWHDAGMHLALVSRDLGTIGPKRDYLAPIGHQIASVHCWDVASGVLQGWH